MILFYDGPFMVYPKIVDQKVEVKEINYKESLFWNKKIEGILGDPNEFELGDIVLNRCFIGDEAHWYIWRQYTF